MSKTFKRLGAFAAALALSMSMAGTAFAAGATLDGGVYGDGTGKPTNDTVTITKELVVFNTDGSAINVPEVTYNYVVTAGTAGATVKDSEDITATVKAGSANQVKTQPSSVTLGGNGITAAANGTVLSNTFDIVFDETAYTDSGVYRYTVTETPAVAKSTVGIEEGADYSNIRYLDVYVRHNDDNTGYSIYGYVLYQGDADSNQISGSEVGKTTGFVHTTDNETAADMYKTFNATIDKTTTGVGADLNHQFAFNVEFANSSVTSNLINLIATASGAATVTDPTAGTLAQTRVAPTIANGGSVTLTGIPVDTTVTVTETNDTSDYYDVTVAVDNTTMVNKVNTAPNGTQAGNVTGTDEASNAFSFTNAITLISPTGVVLRYGPFIFMVAAGIALLVVSMRRRQED